MTRRVMARAGRRLPWWALAGATLGAALAVLVARAPAVWLDTGVAAWTQGRVRVAEASGTLWAGQGRMVVVDVAAQSEQGAEPVLTGMVIPGVFRWQVAPGWLLLGRVQASLVHDSMAAPVVFGGRWDALQIGPGRLLLPALALDQLGSPWTTIRPFGSLQLTWQALTLLPGSWEGQAQIALTEVASALTPVRPLGAYQIELTGQGAQSALRMRTVAGPLRLEGDGTWQVGRGLQAVVWAQAEASERVRLLPLLGLLGRRQGERTMIKIGA